MERREYHKFSLSARGVILQPRANKTRCVRQEDSLASNIGSTSDQCRSKLDVYYLFRS